MIARLAAVALLVAVGCGPEPRVRFAAPPRAGDDYGAVHRRWTRHLHATRDFDTVIDADATLLSTEFRAAWVARVAAMRALAPDARARLEAEQRDDDQRFVDLVVRVQSSKWEWNDLTAPRSLWTASLLDDRGHHVSAVEVQQAPWKPAMMDQLFPVVSPAGTPEAIAFTRAYRVRFPRIVDGAPLATEGTRWVELRIAGPLADTAVRWEAP